jgi:hypothetical protein
MKMEICNHRKWLLNSQNIGTCANPECGEVRQFPLNGGEPVTILKESKCNSRIKKGEKVVVKEDKKHGRKHDINPYLRHIYYEKNREGIVADLITIGRAATQHKWGIPRGGTIFSLEKRWLTLEQIALVNTITLKSLTPLENGRLPSLPEFSDTWEAPVQLKWLEIYEKLIVRHS